MANNLSFDLKQTQKMNMTAQLQQSIKILQLSNQDLSRLVQQELENNPLLQNSNPEKPIEEPSEDHYLSSHYYENSRKTTSSYGNNNSYDVEQEVTLRQHVMQQIYVSISCPNQLAISLQLLDLLDESGYLIITKEEICRIKSILQCSKKEIEQSIDSLKNLEPCGIFASSLAECLKIQLIDRGAFDFKMQKIIENLDMLASSDLERLAKKSSCNFDELGEKLRIIKSLNPKPGSNFLSESTFFTKPDVIVTKENEKLKVQLNSELLPKILLNKKYYTKIKKDTNEENQKYLSEKLNSANWLLKALDQRARTMLRVSTEIIFRQQEFFEHGIKFLKPMTLTEIANVLDIHESTVSRITTNKYISTPMGIYELKFFFSSKIEKKSTKYLEKSNCSSKAIQEIIKELIANEKINDVLSDDSIAEHLSVRNIVIARRTIAKYRDILSIPSSAKRKKQKKFLALTKNS